MRGHRARIFYNVKTKAELTSRKRRARAEQSGSVYVRRMPDVTLCTCHQEHSKLYRTGFQFRNVLTCPIYKALSNLADMRFTRKCTYAGCLFTDQGKRPDTTWR